MKFLNWIKSSGYKENSFSNDSPVFKCIHLDKNSYDSEINNEIPLTDQFELMESYISEGEYFLENQILFCLGSMIHGSGRIYIKTPFGGKMESIFLKTDKSLSFEDKLFSYSLIYDKEILDDKVFEQNRYKLEDTEVVYLEDDFTDDKTIEVKKVSSEETKYFKLYRDEIEYAHDFLGLTFTNHNGYVYVTFNSRNEDITLAKGDSLIFLFEDKTKLNFTFENPGEGAKGYRFNHVGIGFEELNNFLTKNLLKVKLVSKLKKLYSIYHMNHRINENISLFAYQKSQYFNEREGQYLLRFITARFIEMNQNFKIK